MRFQKEEAPEYIEGKTDYTKSELGLIADEFLRNDSKRELCRECGEYGEETGNIQTQPVEEKGEPVYDSSGNQIFINVPELKCSNSHKWFLSEGKARGIDGDDPILFEEHLQTRRKREIYTTLGTPDPSIVTGLYNRSHPQGRKINSAEQRKKHGASYYR